MNRRSFMRFMGAGAAVAPTVKSVVPLPNHNPDKFVGAGFPFPQPWEVRDGLLYDRIRFKAGARLPFRIQFFGSPIGTVCPYSNVIKTYRHTNMYTHGQLPAPNEFLAQRILFAAHPSALAVDLELVSAAMFWEFRVLQKMMARGPMLLNGPARAGLRDIVKDFNTAVSPLPAEVVSTAHHETIAGGVFIGSLMYFAVELECPDSVVVLTPASEGGRGLDLLVALQGAHARGIQ